MDFIDKIRELALQIPKQKEHVRTEEGTKNAMIMPFITALGYNVFDPAEVTPEYIADVGIKKGEKVDYVILRDGKPIILLECKCCVADLDHEHASQLYRYFSVTEARFGILTNGIVYRFYSDLEAPNKMDSKPFFEFDMLNPDENLIDELKKFTKSAFDVDGILTSASELKYTREIRRILVAMLKEPSGDFIKFFGSQIYQGRMTQNVLDQFGEFTRKAFAQFINDQINERLKSALAASTAPAAPVTPEVPVEVKAEREIFTAGDEIEGYHVVKALLRQVIDGKRIAMRDTLSYCNILLDDNRLKTICRLYFNGANKAIGLFDKPKQEEKIRIETVDDIYKYADRLKATIALYDKTPAQ